MVKKTKGKHRLDKFYHLAKEQGYRSRAAFKLIQLNRKYDFLSGARTLLDLCAAPGGWSQVAVKHMPVGSVILAVDLAPIKPIRGVKTLLGDITTQKCRQTIRKEADGQLMDVVLCDGAPNVGGAWSSEAYSQSWLTLEALRLATDVLAPRGTFVTKVFRSKDYTALLYALNQLFTKVESTKPAASRNASAEIFVVCQGYKAPSRIDPRLLDAKHLFQEVVEPPKAAGPDALVKTKIKQRRFREGYEDGLSIARKVVTATEFVVGDSPVEMLGEFTSISFDVPGDDWSGPEGLDATSVAEIIASHSATTNEIKQLCADLLVLGRADFKLLLKWRLMIKKDIQAKAKAAKPQADDNEKEDPSHQPTPEEALQSKEEQLLIEMAEIKDRLDKRKKRERRKRIESKTKARLRAAQLAQGEGLVEDDATVGLFSLAGVSSLKDKSLEANDADDLMVESEEEGQEIEPEESEELDSEEERSRYDAAMDEYLEDSYRSWKIRQRMKNALGTEPSKKRKRLDTTGELDGEEEEEEEDGSGGDDDEQGESEEDDDESEDGGKFETDPKATSRQVRATGDQGTTDLWFAQDVFDDENIDEDEDEEEMTTKRLEKGKQINLTTNGTSPVSPPHPPLEVSALEDQGFEEVPLAGSDSEDSDSDDPNEFDDLDEDAKAEVLALAKKFIRKKSKDELIEAAYNRYAFHDQGLPKWFEEDERKFMRPAPQVTAEEIKTAKDQLRAIDARPIKKVAEAKARKRKRLQAKLAQARQKAEAIANQEDVPMKAKMREIEKLYAQAKSGKSTKGKKKSKGGRNDQYKKKGPPLDARMRKDRRGQDAATRRLKAKGRKMKSGGKARGRR